MNVNSTAETDRQFMSMALQLAHQAESAGEIPVGAIVVRDGLVIGSGFNCPISTHDPTAHAEIAALRQAATSVGNYRLTGATMYCTLEPCVMCSGALVASRLHRLVFATRDLRFGGVRSKFALADSDLLNHRLVITEGVLAAEASALLAAFFRRARTKSLEELA
jgi:tRNA(adenine34) deaminase